MRWSSANWAQLKSIRVDHVAVDRVVELRGEEQERKSYPIEVLQEVNIRVFLESSVYSLSHLFMP